MTPIIIEAAVNGPAFDPTNPHFPRGIEALAADICAAIEAGAAVVHNHVDQTSAAEAATAAYRAIFGAVLARHPDAILCCGLIGSVGNNDIADCYAHVGPLAEAGMAMAIADPGTMNFNIDDAADGTPTGSVVYRNSYDDTRWFMERLAELGLGPSISVFEPSFLRATLGWYRAGKLPAGALVKLYFGGDHSPFTRRPCATTFGLAPTPTALAAYREMMAGCDLPWAVAVIGGDVLASGLAELAIAQGGHVRVGLEDHPGTAAPSNAELVREVARLAESSGRGVATPAQARRILGMAAAGRR